MPNSMKLLTQIIVIILYASTAYARELVEFQKKLSADNVYLYDLSVSGRSNGLIVKKISINRDKCDQDWLNVPAFSLQFGETKVLGTLPCDPIEIDIETNQGNQALTWDNDQVIDGMSDRKFNIPFRGYDSWWMVLTSHDNYKKVKDVDVNKGNCSDFVHQQLSTMGGDKLVLLFGQRLIIALGSCNPIEATVTTEMGHTTFNFDQ